MLVWAWLVAWQTPPTPITPGGSGSANTLVVAVIVAVGAVVAPLIMALITGWQRHREKEADWARQDKVAARLEKRQNEIAAEAITAARKLMARTDEVATTLAETTSAADRKLDEIHHLVNSTLTAAKTAEMNALVEGIENLHIIARLRTAAGQQPDPDSDAVIESMQARVDVLRADLADRIRQTALAEAHAAQATTEGGAE